MQTGNAHRQRTFAIALTAGLLIAFACGLGLWLDSEHLSSMGLFFVPAPATVVALALLLSAQFANFRFLVGGCVGALYLATKKISSIFSH